MKADDRSRPEGHVKVDMCGLCSGVDPSVCRAAQPSLDLAQAGLGRRFGDSAPGMWLSRSRGDCKVLSASTSNVHMSNFEWIH